MVAKDSMLRRHCFFSIYISKIQFSGNGQKHENGTRVPKSRRFQLSNITFI